MANSVFERIAARGMNGGKKLTVDQQIAFAKKLRADAEAKTAKEQHLAKANQRISKVNEALGNCGVRTAFKCCSFDNYYMTASSEHLKQQQEALRLSKTLVNPEYHKGVNYITGFIYSGNTGTGKNHLASALVQEVIKGGGTGLVITMIDLISKFNYSDFADRKRLIDTLCEVDVLVLDELGMHKIANDSRK